MNQSIRPVARALMLLQALNKRPCSTLHQLHLDTRLPKPTVFRLATTLCNEGYARANDGTYSLTAKVWSLSDGYTELDRLVEVSIPITIRVTRETNWPLAVGTLDGMEVLVRHSTMPYSRLSTVRTTLEHRHGLLHSALGNVYLAYIAPAVRSALIAELLPEYGIGTTVAMFDEVVCQVSACGYGIRLPRRRGDSATIAVPILVAGELMAALSLTTFGAVLNGDSAESFVPLLLSTAAEIVMTYQNARSIDVTLP
ncbi:helix-turn-helix domain-containing protein [Paraburkholderia sediminicola]|uniref:helix-turn-helix domain-containing protein n=1 Tax=Paraburkholderia sediminicola TaxID=458836 RepID=UPI0038BACBBD